MNAINKESFVNEDNQLTNEKPNLYPSPHFAQWLFETGGSLALSTYQSGRLFLIGCRDNGSLYALERTIGTAMGLAFTKQQLWIGCRDQIWRFINTGAGEIHNEQYDAIFVPHSGYFIGQSNTHDVLADIYFKNKHYDFLYANTQYSCIASLNDNSHFQSIWQPNFINELKAEDRCHLNGICAQQNELAFASICAQTNHSLAWKKQQLNGGIIIDIRTHQIMCDGLSMPHSPRWYNNTLWLLNSGNGEFGFVDIEKAKFIAIANCAGFARGLSFIGDYAIIALSRLRPNKEGILNNIKLAQNLEQRRTFQRCGLQIFNLKTNQLEHWLHIDGVVTELYDVIHLAGISKPYSTGFNEHTIQLNRTLLTSKY